MIFPCIDLMDGKVVQLVQGREKALEGDSPEEMLRKFAAFPEIQVIDLDAAMGRGSNDGLVQLLASKAVTRVGGGVRTWSARRALVRAGRASRDRGDVRLSLATESTSRSSAELREAIGRERLIVARRFQGAAASW